MSPEQFQKIEALYHEARERVGAQRAELLAKADPELRREVESLLAERGGQEFLDRLPPGSAGGLGDVTATVSGLAAGADFGRYRIEGKLGEGGMGEVFRAIDTRLGRAVAIKTTREQFGARFEREARAISSLNHPNICTLYDVGPNYLVMELIEGETIATRLRNGPLPTPTAVLYAMQIADALAEAHSKGIVHRDLKPGNVMIARTGVKVLDFGLAKSELDETISVSQMIIGTPAYMSPEQRAGRLVDYRSDIYSFGCVLYEMLTGVRAGYQRHRIAPRKLEAIVTGCLEEDVSARWTSAVELGQRLSAIAGSLNRRTAGTIQRTSSGVRRTSNVREKSNIVLGEFTNTTGDPEFDEILRTMMAIELGKFPDIALLPDARIRETLRLMVRPADAKLIPEIAAEICERTGCAAVVHGSIARLGQQYVLGLRTRNCQTGEILNEEQLLVSQKDEVFRALGQMAKRFGTKTGELPVIPKQTVMTAEITTASLEAWRSYHAGTTIAMRLGAHAERVQLLERAIEVDPKFAMAYSALGRSYDSLGQSELAAEFIAKAYELRELVSDRENFYITFNYYRQVPRNLEQARLTLESWMRKHPADLMPHGFMSGFVCPGTARHERAVEEGLKAIGIDADFAIGYFNSAFALLYLNRPDEAAALMRKATDRKIEVVEFSLCSYFIAFLQKDPVQVERVSRERKARLESQGWFQHQEAMTLAYHGRLNEANRLSEQAVTLAKQAGLQERAAKFEGCRAVWNAFYGLATESRRGANAALTLSRGRDADYGPGLAFALLGDKGSARDLQADLERLYPEDTSVQFSYLPVLRALDAWGDGDLEKARQMIQCSAAFELAVPGTAYFTGAAFFGALYPSYVSGLVHSRQGRFREAKSEFQKILHHPGITLNDPVGPMTRLAMARVLSANGETEQSASLYQELLAIWRDADSDVPVVAQARTEEALLH